MSKVFVIAEAGVNHNGQLGLAEKLIDVAVEAGADAVKFQTFTAAKCISRFAIKADYQRKQTEESESQLEMVKKLELDEKSHYHLLEYAKKKEIEFLSTPFDDSAIDLLLSLGLKTFKIPSGEITNLPYLRRVGSLSKDIILSTGMAHLEEIKTAIQILCEAGTERNRITVLHCNTEYPTPMSDVNLNAMCTIRDQLKVKVGYSDHTMGIEIPIAAVALGAVVIEKHFTLDRQMPGPDHKASLEPYELKQMVQAIRNIEIALGTGVKVPSISEKKNIAIARRSIVASRFIRKGEVFSVENLAVKRPGSGISPMKWDELLGQRSKRDFQEDELIEI